MKELTPQEWQEFQAEQRLRAQQQGRPALTVAQLVDILAAHGLKRPDPSRQASIYLGGHLLGYGIISIGVDPAMELMKDMTVFHRINTPRVTPEGILKRMQQAQQQMDALAGPKEGTATFKFETKWGVVPLEDLPSTVTPPKKQTTYHLRDKKTKGKKRKQWER